MAKTQILSIFWHNVESSFPSADGGNPNADLFREHIRFLVENYTPISIFDFLEIHAQKQSTRSYTKPPILLGFDDGFKNVILHALPILEEFKTPALFFVIGEILRDPQFIPWYVERKQLIRKAVGKTIVYANRKLNLGVSRDVMHLMRLFDASFRTCRSDPERQTVLKNFAEVLGVARPLAADLDENLKFVNAKDLADISTSSLLTIASHAMSHRDLPTLSYNEQVAELQQSDSLLRELCPAYFPVIAYPNGSFTAETIGIATRIYKVGFAVFLGASYQNLYAYPRIGLLGHSVPELAYILSPKRRKYVLPLKRVLHLTRIQPL